MVILLEIKHAPPDPVFMTTSEGVTFPRTLSVKPLSRPWPGLESVSVTRRSCSALLYLHHSLTERIRVSFPKEAS